MNDRRLEGKKVAITGPRKAEELSRMVAKEGGIPLVRPASGTVFLDDEQVNSEVERITAEDFDWYIFTTGVGIETILEISSKLGIYDRLLRKLRQSKVAARGYKAIGALKKLGITPVVRDEDGTTAGLVHSFSSQSLQGCRVALQLHGDPAPKLIEFLERQRASFSEILPYRHIPPADEDLQQLIDDIRNGEADAVMFTSGPQVRFPFAYAKRIGADQELIRAFGEQTVAVAVGKYTAECLREEGVSRIVVPEVERMGHMVQALAQYYAEGRRM